jgi:preprotein translocase subunit SecA
MAAPGHEDELPDGLDALRERFRGWRRRRSFDEARLRARSRWIGQRTEALAALSPDELANATKAVREELRRKRSTSRETVDEAFAVLSLLMARSMGMEPFEEQKMGALAMSEEWLAEMATGEGKTLTAALCAALWAWRWERCHVITSNDYLARRDAAQFAPFFRAAGLSVGAIEPDLPPEARRKIYRHAVTYTTGAQILADYLRDELAFGLSAESTAEEIAEMAGEGVVGRRILPSLRCAIVDEADSVLADHAVTPLIISQAGEDPALKEATLHAFRVVRNWAEGVHFSVDRAVRSIRLLDPAHEAMASEQEAFPSTWRAVYRIAFLCQKAVLVRFFFERGKEYVVVDDKVVVVDEKTGRLMPQTTWSDGLHQAVEAKEGLPLTDPTRASIKMTYQTFFRLYPKLAGMSGTLSEIAGECWFVFQRPVGRIPTRRPRDHRASPDRIVADRPAIREAMVREVRSRSAAGQAVLVGSRSISESLALSGALGQEGIPHEVLNALEHEREAEIIASAGQSGKVTIATNMAGRGTDIALSKAVREAGGLHVLGSERHDSARVDRQLVGRASRQGDPGSSQFWMSLDDSLIAGMLPDRLLRWMSSRLHWPVLQVILRRLVIFRQRWLEGRASHQRIALLRHEQRMSKSLSFAGRSSAKRSG